MRRIGLVLALGLTLAGLAEPQRSFEVGVLVFGTESRSLSRGVESLREALRDFGWIDGQNVILHARFSGLSEERLAAMAQGLAQQQVDVIVGFGTPPTEAARRATTSIPIVMSASADPVAAGFVSNLGRPDSNITGTSLLITETAGKRLQLLKEVTPRLSRAAVLNLGTRGPHQRSVDELRAAASQLGVEFQSFVFQSVDGLPQQLAKMQAWRADALVVVAGQPIDEARGPIGELALRHHLPTIFSFREYVEAGGLMSYGPNMRATHRRAAYYVDRLLRGAKPADLPIEQVTVFELVINLKTAKALGLKIPQSVLVRADHVIE